ncbi:hypothetical protein lerEdw1_011196, partial [Lerista edwardsae]
EPLQEWPLGPLDVKEEPLDVVQGEIPKEHAEIFRAAQQNVDGEVAVPGLGIAHPTLLLPAEGQDMAEAELTKALGVQVDQEVNLRKMGAPFHMVEQPPLQPSQRTMFWKVLQAEGENVGSLGKQLLRSKGFLGPQLRLDPHAVKKEEADLSDPVESLRLSGQDSGKELGMEFLVASCNA